VCGQRHQDVGVPGAIEAQRFIELAVAAADVEPRRMDAEQQPRQIATRRILAVGTRMTTGAPLVPRCVRASVRKYPSPLKRRPNDDDSTACRTTGMWCRVSWKPSGKPTTSSELPTSTASTRPGRCAGREGAIERRCRQGAAVDLDHRHVDVPSRVQALPPEAFSPVVQRNRKPVDSARLSGSICNSISMRLGKCRLGLSSSTCRLVTRNSRSPRAKKKPLALVSSRCCSKVQIRDAVRRMVSIIEMEKPLAGGRMLVLPSGRGPALSRSGRRFRHPPAGSACRLADWRPAQVEMIGDPVDCVNADKGGRTATAADRPRTGVRQAIAGRASAPCSGIDR
jgi:hypothetical protein